MKRVIFHIDVNSAYLSWEAVSRLAAGDTVDLREIPAAVGGDIETRHGVILGKVFSKWHCDGRAGGGCAAQMPGTYACKAAPYDVS